MATKNITYEAETDEGTIAGEITVSNQTWNDRVARLYAAHHIQHDQDVDPLAFDVTEIDVEYRDAELATDGDR